MVSINYNPVRESASMVSEINKNLAEVAELYVTLKKQGVKVKQDYRSSSELGLEAFLLSAFGVMGTPQIWLEGAGSVNGQHFKGSASMDFAKISEMGKEYDSKVPVSCESCKYEGDDHIAQDWVEKYCTQGHGDEITSRNRIGGGGFIGGYSVMPVTITRRTGTYRTDRPKNAAKCGQYLPHNSKGALPLANLIRELVKKRQ